MVDKFSITVSQAENGVRSYFPRSCLQFAIYLLFMFESRKKIRSNKTLCLTTTVLLFKD